MPHCCKLSAMKKECSCQEKLPDDFAPGPLDVICARGKQAKSHPGNVRYQKIIESYMDRYVCASSKLQKMSIISEIVTKIRFASPDGGFVKLKEGGWYEVGDHFAREKVSQSLRDNLHVLYRSSCKSKTLRRAIRRREEEKQKELETALKRHQFHAQNVFIVQQTLQEQALREQVLQEQALRTALPTSHHLTAALAANAVTAQKLVPAPKSDAEIMVAQILLAQAQQVHS